MPYSNSEEIERAFYKEKPYEDIDNTIYKQTLWSIINAPINNQILYLKSSIDFEASIMLSRTIKSFCQKCIIDDPREIKIQTLSWYVEKICNSQAVIAHFLSETHTGAELHNAKASLVCGLAFGLGKEILMMAHEPFHSPIDYADILKTHDTANKCETIATEWLNHFTLKAKSIDASISEIQKKNKNLTDLQRISIGESIAEHEEQRLLEYFIQTAAYDEAKKARHSLFVGRKGSGKTAILYKLSDDILSDKRNHLCLIKPVGYEISGIIEIIEQTRQTSEKGYLIQSLWKYLIYTELVKSIYQDIKDKPVYYQPTKDEDNLISFISQHINQILPDFSIRLEQAVLQLQNLGQTQTSTEKRTKISELLHEEIIGKLQNLVTPILATKHKVAILIDNLDKAWDPKKDIVILCDLLFGLIDINQTIVNNFQRISTKNLPIDLSIITFLRSDIFEQVINHALERDKLLFSRIFWNDPELLFRVIEERFAKSINISDPNDVWVRFFPQIVEGVPIKQYIKDAILPQPRDWIYFVKAALSNAVTRRHSIIEEQDILDAQKQYSRYALDSLYDENAIHFPSLPEILYEFVAAPEIIDQAFLISAMHKCSVPEYRLQEAVDLLCDLAFLGREVNVGRFEFQHNEQEKQKWQTMARRIYESASSKTPRFKINRPFHSYLEIKKQESDK